MALEILVPEQRIVSFDLSGCDSESKSYMIEQVFIRMSVKDIVRCMIVCKSWGRFIGDPGFRRAYENMSGILITKDKSKIFSFAKNIFDILDQVPDEVDTHQVREFDKVDTPAPGIRDPCIHKNIREGYRAMYNCVKIFSFAKNIFDILDQVPYEVDTHQVPEFDNVDTPLQDPGAELPSKESESKSYIIEQELVDLPEGRKAIGSKWTCKVKFRSSGEIDRYKDRLVAQGFRQKEGIDYEKTFSPNVKMVTIICLLNIVVSMSWSVFQLDVNNAFLYGDLEESDKGVFLALLIYVDDIIITGNSVFEIEKFKVFLKSKFMIKDLGKLKYFLGIEVVDTDKASDKDPLLENITDYEKLMGKLIYLTNTKPNISYVVHCLSQFMHSPLTSNIKIAFKILRYLKSFPGLGIHITKTSRMFLTAYSDTDWAKCVVISKSITGYCVFLNNSLVSCKSKKQNTLSKSSIEAEYRALASVTNEVDSANQIADILTKGLDTVQHLELVKILGMFDVYHVETKEGY
ncbi:ribonuclease H-like domain-containing protein [Tanacetum coccineum]